jgi:formylglycine-generating enzyme required for sulfatase activity
MAGFTLGGWQNRTICSLDRMGFGRFYGAITSPMRFFCLSFFLFLFVVFDARGQAPEEMKQHRSEVMGEVFVAIPFTPVLFAQHETTVAQWQTFLADSKYVWDHKPHFAQGQDHPVVMVTLQDAQAFCAWLTDKERQQGKLNESQTYRLPTSEEWDAAVGLLRTRKTDLDMDEQVQDDRAFPWGSEWPPPAGSGNFAEAEIPNYSDGDIFTAPVGKFKASAEGLYDLAGNVWEWTWKGEVRAEQDGVLRGGSWAYFRADCLRSSYLYKVPGQLRMPTVGFRCVFEDRQRTAVMLVTMEQEKKRLRDQRRSEVMGGPVNPSEVEEMRKKLMSTDVSRTLPDTAALKPATAGGVYKNSLGMEFVPFGHEKLAGAMEVRLQDYEIWLKGAGREWSDKPGFLNTASHPAVGVSWQDAQAFCRWLTTRDRSLKLIQEYAAYRLPTDAEWSAMAGLIDEKGIDPATKDKGDQRHFPWSARGDFPPPMLSTNLDAAKISGYSDSFSYTSPVNAEPPNELGIQGLGGNAAEWCEDTWPGIDGDRVVRGGSWLTADREKLLTSARRHYAADKAGADIGFRVILQLQVP